MMLLTMWMAMLAFVWTAIMFTAIERQRVQRIAVANAMICEPCGSTVYFAEDLGKCRIDSSCSAPMGEWDESFVDGLSS